MPSSAPSTELDAALWHRRSEPQAREALVRHFAGLVRFAARRLHVRRVDRSISLGDYEQYGFVGLMEAIDKYSPVLGARFETYALHRIEGAILNGVPRLTEFHRQVHARRGLLLDRRSSVIGADACAHEPEEEATEQLPSYREQDALQRLADVAIGLALSFVLEDAALYVDGDAALPDAAFDGLANKQSAMRLQVWISRLPAQERSVLEQHYFQEVTFEGIAVNMGVSRARISQIHRKALRRLRVEISGDMGWELKA